jgi:hypothetical protein
MEANISAQGLYVLDLVAALPNLVKLLAGC